MKWTILVVVFLVGIAVVALAQAQTTGGIGAFPPPNNGQTGFTYQASSNTYHFTRTDGTFSGVVVYDNSGTPGFPNTNDFSMDAVNTDGQRELITYHFNNKTGNYERSSALNLDEDYHFDLGSFSGGGIGTNSAGDTCIPTNILTNGPCNVPTALHINTEGVISQYLGLSLDPGGNGTSTIARAVNGSATGTVSNWLAWTTPSSGYGSADFYELSWVGVVTSAAPGASAIATWSFTDESGPNSCSSVPTAFGFAGNRLELTCRFYSAPKTPVSISVTTLGGTPTYASHLRILIH